MAELRPIKPLLYNPEVVGDLSDVLTPPYDVIYPPEQEMYRSRSPYSAIHIELPVDAEGIGRYERAGQILRQWQVEGALLPHDAPAFFVHAQEYELDGERRTRTALLAGVRLEPWEAGVVLPHERTFRGPKQDRLELLRSTSVAPSSVFSLYEQPAVIAQVLAETTGQAPLATATEGGVTHRLWAITNEAHIEAISTAMSDRPLYIADGHHRYETALAYRDERVGQTAQDPDAAYNFLAMSLVAFDDPGLVVLPTHRLVSGMEASSVDSLQQVLADTFNVREIEQYERTERGVAALLSVVDPYALVLYARGRLLLVTGGREAAQQLPTDRSEAWRALDLAVLHELVLGRALGVPVDRPEEHVTYTRDVPAMFEQVDSGAADVAAFVRPTDVRQLRAVADASDKMPQKSTYFYPKFPAGLVINRLDVRLPAVQGVPS